MRRFCSSPVFVIIDVRPHVEGIPTTAYMSMEEVESDAEEIKRTFKHIPSSIGHTSPLEPSRLFRGLWMPPRLARRPLRASVPAHLQPRHSFVNRSLGLTGSMGLWSQVPTRQRRWAWSTCCAT